MDLKQKDNESFLDWKYRLIEAKFNKEISETWQQIVEILGLDCHEGSLRKAAYGIIEAKQHYEKKMQEKLPNEALEEIEDKIRELRKERVKYQDWKREENKFVRAEAKFEALLEEMAVHMLKLPSLEKSDEFAKTPISNPREGLALFSDWHYGAIVDNSFNVYNREVAKQRIEKLTAEVIKRGKHEGIRVLHVAQLGDIINGFIHLTTRLFSDIDTVQQTMEATELLAQVLGQLCSEFPEVIFYNVIGNHGRTVPKKEEATIKDNFEYFICWYLRQRLREFDNLTIIEDKEGIITTEIMGQKIALAHGNYEKLNSAEGLTQMYGYVFDQVLFGHYHHNHQKELGQTDIIVNSSLIGADEYALTLRRISKPAQKFLIYGANGLDTIHNIVLK